MWKVWNGGDSNNDVEKDRNDILCVFPKKGAQVTLQPKTSYLSQNDIGLFGQNKIERTKDIWLVSFRINLENDEVSRIKGTTESCAGKAVRRMILSFQFRHSTLERPSKQAERKFLK